MWARLRLDLTAGDLLRGGVAVLFARDPRRCRVRIEARFDARARAFVCLSVRSGLDLLLDALALPEGSEVLVSALTIPDMLRVLREHALVPVPVDLDLATLGPSPGALAAAVGLRSRVLLVAHLCGARLDMGPIADFAREHGLVLIEDCAQAFTGDGWRGSEAALASLFSFGTIKTATALGGGVCVVRDARVLARMREAEGRWPGQARGSLARKLVKAALLHLASSRPLFALFARMVRSCGGDLDALLHGAVRGFPGADLFAALRRRPSAPLLALLARRLARTHAGHCAARASNGAHLVERLVSRVEIPARAAPYHSHWIFPVLAREPDRLVRALRDAGFDATRRSSLAAVEAPPHRPELVAREALRFLAGVVFLPAYAALDGDALADLAAIVLAELSPELGEQATLAPVQRARDQWRDESTGDDHDGDEDSEARQTREPARESVPECSEADRAEEDEREYEDPSFARHHA